MKKLLLLTLLCLVPVLSGCGTLDIVANAVDPATGQSVGLAIVDAVTGAPLATLDGAAKAVQGGPASIIGWAVASVLGIGAAFLKKKASTAHSAVDEVTTAIEHLKAASPDAWNALKPLLAVQLTKATEALVDKIHEKPTV